MILLLVLGQVFTINTVLMSVLLVLYIYPTTLPVYFKYSSKRCKVSLKSAETQKNVTNFFEVNTVFTSVHAFIIMLTGTS